VPRVVVHFQPQAYDVGQWAHSLPPALVSDEKIHRSLGDGSMEIEANNTVHITSSQCHLNYITHIIYYFN